MAVSLFRYCFQWGMWGLGLRIGLFLSVVNARKRETAEAHKKAQKRCESQPSGACCFRGLSLGHTTLYGMNGQLKVDYLYKVIAQFQFRVDQLLTKTW